MYVPLVWEILYSYVTIDITTYTHKLDNLFSIQTAYSFCPGTYVVNFR